MLLEVGLGSEEGAGPFGIASTALVGPRGRPGQLPGCTGCTHVEEEERQNRQPRGRPGEGPTRVLRCACAWWDDASEGRYTEGEQRCDPQHYHHVGNDVADIAADRGKGLAKGHMVREEGGEGVQPALIGCM